MGTKRTPGPFRVDAMAVHVPSTGRTHHRLPVQIYRRPGDPADLLTLAHEWRQNPAKRAEDKGGPHHIQLSMDSAREMLDSMAAHLEHFKSVCVDKPGLVDQAEGLLQMIEELGDSADDAEGRDGALIKAIELGVRFQWLVLQRADRWAMAGMRQSRANMQKAEKRHAISNQLQEWVQEEYQRLIDQGSGTRTELANAKEDIRQILMDNWEKFKRLRGAPKNPPNPRSIQRWTQGIEPRHD